MVYVLPVASLVMTSPGVGGITPFAGGPGGGAVAGASGGGIVDKEGEDSDM